MKKAFLLFGILALAACSDQKKPLTVQLSNPTATPRPDESVVLIREQLDPADHRLPAVMDAQGHYVPSQVDDLDGDGQWDELAFVTDLAPHETAEFKIVWVEPENYPEFPVRTNIRYGVMTRPGHIEELTSDMHYKDQVYFINTEGYPYQMDCVAWENDLVGFRHYYDGRNNKDYFGKRVTDMVLDRVGIREDGTPGDTYHVWADWGRDIMSVGTSFGIGGLAAWVDDSRFVRMGRVNEDPVDVIDSTGYTLIFEGPVRSRFALDFYGWDIEGTKIDLRQEATIWAGKHNYDNRVIAKNLPENIRLMTGFLYNFNDMPLEELDFSQYIGMATHDHQSYDKEFIMGVGMILPKNNVEKLFLSPEYIPQISRTWCAVLNLEPYGEAEYKAYAAWEHQDERFRDREYFLDLIRSEGARLDDPVKVTLK
ncbi:MAG: DUF4861 domain-containing protein [Rikenellaceae bacterium]|nr:DUF4861 domain-containing protein [Rikenellaceae bacterium]